MNFGDRGKAFHVQMVDMDLGRVRHQVLLMCDSSMGFGNGVINSVDGGGGGEGGMWHR